MKPSPKFPAIRRTTSAFTLIELLVVITIIAILAALTLQTSGYIQEKAASSRAKTEIAAMEAALESYKIDNGTYPTGDGSATSTKALINALALDGMQTPPKGKIYMEIPMNMLQSQSKGADIKQSYTASTALVDPFGNAYRYYYNPTGTTGTNPVSSTVNNGPAFFDLWSQGKKNYPAGQKEKWITNW